MATTTNWYGAAIKNMFAGTANSVWDWDTDTIKLSLHTSTYAPNLDTHAFYSDVTNEIASTGDYTAGAAGGITLASKTLAVDAANNEVEIDAADAVVVGGTFTARYAVVRKSTGTTTTSPLIALIDLGGDQTVAAANFTLQFSADGVIKATY